KRQASGRSPSAASSCITLTWRSRMNIRFMVILGGLVLGAATGSAAQDAVIGAMGGATYSDFSHPDTPSRWGFTGGLFAGVETYRSLNLFEVSYTQKGGKGTRIDYVEVGVTAGGLAGSSRGSRGRVYGGVQVAFPVSCSTTNAPFTGFCDNKNTEWGFPVGIMLGKWSASGGRCGARRALQRRDQRREPRGLQQFVDVPGRDRTTEMNGL